MGQCTTISAMALTIFSRVNRDTYRLVAWDIRVTRDSHPTTPPLKSTPPTPLSRPAHAMIFWK